MCWSSLPWLHTIRTPTLVLAGALDPLVPPANGVQLARLLPDARLQLLPESGHLCVLDPDNSSQELLLDFFGASELGDSTSWSTGRVVDDDREVEDAFRDSVGAQPQGVLSDAYRHLVRPHYSNQHSATR